MRERRAVLRLVGVSVAVLGVWAQFFPRSFYEDFPLGRAWVASDGPWNEHLVRDVGGLYLALTVVAFAVAARGSAWMIRATALAVLVSSVPHLIYHATHLEPFGAVDRVAMLTALAFLVVVPALLAAAPVREGPAPGD